MIPADRTMTSAEVRAHDDTVAKLIAAHEGFAAAGAAIGSSLLAAANYRREVGIYLESLKTATFTIDGNERKVVSHGEWGGCLKMGAEPNAKMIWHFLFPGKQP